MPIPERVTLQDITTARRGLGRDRRPEQEIRGSLNRVNQDSIFEEEDSRYVTEEWTGNTSINGVPPSHIYSERSDVTPNSKVYILRDTQTDKVVLFQPHKPEITGLEPIEDPIVEGEEHRSQIALGRARARIVAKVNADLDGEPDPDTLG